MYDLYVMTEVGFSGNHFSKRTISQAPVTALQSGPLEEVAVTLPLNLKGRWQAGVADPQANTYPQLLLSAMTFLFLGLSPGPAILFLAVVLV